MKFEIKTKREDGKIQKCIVSLPKDFIKVSNVDKDGRYDERLENQVLDKIDFEGNCFEYVSIKEIRRLK